MGNGGDFVLATTTVIVVSACGSVSWEKTENRILCHRPFRPRPSIGPPTTTT